MLVLNTGLLGESTMSGISGSRNARTSIQGEVETSHAVFLFELYGFGDIKRYQPEVDVLVTFGVSPLVARK